MVPAMTIFWEPGGKRITPGKAAQRFLSQHLLDAII